jgi:membrane-associated protein
LQRTEQFFARYGAMAVFLSRFMPIIRTFAPFVAGVGRMSWARFLGYNFAGGLCWVMLFIWGGYWFGNIPLVRDNFALVTIGIIIVSLLPIVGVLLQQRLTGAVAVPRGSGRPRAG